MTSAYHPSADGQAEWTNQTIETALRCVLVRQPGEDNWEELLLEVKFALNTMVNTMTKETPFKLLYGVEPNSEFGTKDTGDSMTEDFIRK